MVCLCGSTRFKQTFLETQLEESLAGRIVLSLPVYSHVDGCDLTPREIQTLTELQVERVKLADELLVIDVGGYVGSATADEIALASSLGKRIRYWSREHSHLPRQRLRPMDVALEVAAVHAEQGFPISKHPTLDVAPALKELTCSLVDEEAAELREAVANDDLVAIADAVAELVWVVIVATLTFGIPIGEVFAEVLRSNRSKADADGKVVRAPSGKIVKGPGFSPPDPGPILRRHTAPAP
jgi:NTP pyrophosphatase (non-canonical NTP hydrolase)